MKRRPAEQLLDRVLVVDPGLDRARQLEIDHRALVHAVGRAAASEQRRRNGDRRP